MVDGLLVAEIGTVVGVLENSLRSIVPIAWVLAPRPRKYTIRYEKSCFAPQMINSGGTNSVNRPDGEFANRPPRPSTCGRAGSKWANGAAAGTGGFIAPAGTG